MRSLILLLSSFPPSPKQSRGFFDCVASSDLASPLPPLFSSAVPFLLSHEFEIGFKGVEIQSVALQQEQEEGDFPPGVADRCRGRRREIREAKFPKFGFHESFFFQSKTARPGKGESLRTAPLGNTSKHLLRATLLQNGGGGGREEGRGLNRGGGGGMEESWGSKKERDVRGPRSHHP